jgi:signal transduction histidine kinase
MRRNPGGRSFAHAVYMIASSFVSLDDSDTIIESALRILGETCEAGRTFVFRFSESAGTMTNTHEWCAPGVDPQIEMLTDLPIDMFPWWMEQLRDGAMILIPDVGAMPSEAAAERAILQEQSVKSVLVFPLYEEGLLAGFIGIDNVQSSTTWEEETREYLQVASEMVSSTLTRDRRAREARERTGELEQAYENLKTTQQQLLQAEKLSGIGMLAAGFAHEINNPLGFIRSNTEMMLKHMSSIRSEVAPGGPAATEDGNLDFVLSDLDDMLNSNIEGMDRITTIIDNLMQFALVDRDTRHEPASISEILESTLTIAAPTLSMAAEVVFRPGTTPPVPCNVNEMKQVFLNILFNAAQSTSIHGSRKGRIEIETGFDVDRVHCVVRDNGPGIPPAVVNRLFEPFFTTRDVGQGTGLGLSIAYDLVVNKHGGEITAGNNATGGAYFQVSLPLQREGTAP